MRLGQFQDALEVLEFDYPQSPANEMEPSVPDPSKHVSLWYYRAYCRSRTGVTFTGELQKAASLSTTYVFPSRAASIEILQGRWLPGTTRPDANMQYLNALLLLSARRTDEAITALDLLRTQRPNLPALHRTLGRVWLDIKGDKAKALPILQEGLRYEPANTDLQDAIRRAQR